MQSQKLKHAELHSRQKYGVAHAEELVWQGEEGEQSWREQTRGWRGDFGEWTSVIHNTRHCQLGDFFCVKAKTNHRDEMEQ
jgi:hypothetical protein